MAAAANKAVVREIFARTAVGDGRPFVDALAQDVRWTIIGSTSWSRTYEGKSAVVSELLGPLAALIDGPNRVSAERVIAEEDLVVVEGRNHSSTKAGSAYPQRYCWVITMRDGKMAEIVEYADTALIEDVLVRA